SGAVKDITIRNNEFRFPCNSSYYQFCEAIISIYPEIPSPNPLKPYHKNIKIENNSFNPSDYPILYAVSVDGLSFKNNTVKRSFSFTPWYPEKYNFRIEACKNVEISGNKIEKNVLGKNILLKGMQPTELNLKNTELSVEIAKPN
ncbi:MAG: alpha-1,3-galactosidase B, partial [Flavobacterium nitrogenifigens]